MYIFKNSLKNLVRSKGRNLMILLIAILTLASVTISFSIQTISGLAIQRYKNSFGVLAKLEPDWEKLNQDFPPKEITEEDGSIHKEQNMDVPEVKAEEYENYANSQYVKQTLYKASYTVHSNSLKPVGDNLSQGVDIITLEGKSKSELMEWFGVSTEKELEEAIGGKEELEMTLDSKSDAIGWLVGVTDFSLLEDFSKGMRKIEKGNYPEKINEVMIGSVFAEKNNLKPGDTISISGPSKSMDTKEIPLKIVGIYGDYYNQATATEWGLFYGQIYTAYDTLMNTGFHYLNIEDVSFMLKDKESAAAFEQELRTKGLSKYLSLTYSTAEYENKTKHLKNLSRIAEIFTLSASVTGAAILLLISFINVRGRKYEIGVLRSMGMKKTNVARGMIYEVWLLMLISFAAGIFAGAALIKPIASSLSGSLTDISISLPSVAIALCAGLAFFLSIVSSLCAVFAVMHHEPMKILSERN